MNNQGGHGLSEQVDLLSDEPYAERKQDAAYAVAFFAVRIRPPRKAETTGDSDGPGWQKGVQHLNRCHFSLYVRIWRKGATA
jgi:hypothetical protein